MFAAREDTEIQNLQISDGDVCRKLEIPLYMVFPRLFTCPTLSIPGKLKINFEINLVVLFENNFVVTENFPIFLYQSNKDLASKDERISFQ